MKKFCLCVFVLLAFVGCATTSHFVEGRNFDENKMKNIVKGSSTKADILKLYGEPIDKGIDEKYNENWVYLYAETDSQYNAWTTDSKADRRVKKLIVVFDEKDVVRNFVFSDSTNPMKYDYKGF
ncbi:MAG: outer membrane protein assembly factor BamE [Candidatus Omnitrophota bacterium]